MARSFYLFNCFPTLVYSYFLYCLCRKLPVFSPDFRYKQPKSEVEKYVDKVSSPEDRFDLLLELQLWRKAAEVAFKMRDPQRLEAVARMCNNDNALVSSIQDMLMKL